MSTNGKGDRNRPRTVNYKTWEKNYERIFKQTTNNKKKPNK